MKVWNTFDSNIFCVAHTLGWSGKAMLLRDYWICWVRHLMPHWHDLPFDVSLLAAYLDFCGE
jgi:hypothetical protein